MNIIFSLIGSIESFLIKKEMNRALVLLEIVATRIAWCYCNYRIARSYIYFKFFYDEESDLYKDD